MLGVSSGIFSAVPENEKMQYSGLYQKAMYCITKGVQFVQIDLESLSEFRTPNLKEDIKKLDGMGVTFGIHSETKAFGIEVSELDSAIDTDYKFGHERLREILENSGSIGSKYLLIHSSESEPFLMLERHMQPSALTDFFGNPFRNFLENNTSLLEWLMGGKSEEVSERAFNEWLTKGKATTGTDLGKAIRSQEYMWQEFLSYTLGEILRMEIEGEVGRWEINERKKYEEFTPEQKKGVQDYIKASIPVHLRSWTARFLETLQSRSLHYGPERIPYYFTAKWMENQQDPLWTSIVNASVEYFAKMENKKPEEWLASKNIKSLSIDDENFRRLNYIWVPAVSAKYIWGHLNQDKNSGPNKYPDLKPILKKYKMPLVLETPMAHRGTEEWLRFPNPLQMYYLAKNVGIEYVQLALDLEHMLSIKLDPEKVFDCFPEGAGKFVRVIHAGYPSALSPAHIPIPLGSDQQIYLYKMYYKLWEKGFGKDKSIDYYLVFERGGGQDPVQQSILALRKIVEYLEKDVKPEDLHKHPDFFGLDIGEIGSWERQWQAVHEHGRDPLKGLLIASEEEYGFLGRAATEKGKAEIWKKEELR